MTRQQYLAELRHELSTLPVEEQEEALEYYRGYFEDADNDEEVMSEFGSPAALAQTIKEKFASVPDITHRPQQNEGTDGESGNFSSDEVRSLDISLGIAEIVMAKGENFSVAYRGLSSGDIRYGLSPFGTFTVESTGPLTGLNFWRHNNAHSDLNHPRILIKIPEHTKLDLLRLHIGAGSFSAKDIDIVSARSYIDVGAGNIVLNRVCSTAGKLQCGMGNISYTGTLGGLVNIDCGMGNVSLNLDGREEDYSLSAKVGLGHVRMNELKKDGIGTLLCTDQKQNHFSVNCGMGAVTIKIH